MPAMLAMFLAMFCYDCAMICYVLCYVLLCSAKQADNGEDLLPFLGNCRMTPVLPVLSLAEGSEVEGLRSSDLRMQKKRHWIPD